MSINERQIRTWGPTIGVIVVNILALGALYGAFSERLKAVEKHVIDSGVHMNFKERVKEFPTRPEFEAAMQVIQRDKAAGDERAARMEQKLDRIYEILVSEKGNP